MELAPITFHANPQPSIFNVTDPMKNQKPKQQIPPLQRTQLGVQIRSQWDKYPRDPTSHATTIDSNPILANIEARLRKLPGSSSHRPANSPISIVAKVGMKLNVA